MITIPTILIGTSSRSTAIRTIRAIRAIRASRASRGGRRDDCMESGNGWHGGLEVKSSFLSEEL